MTLFATTKSQGNNNCDNHDAINKIPGVVMTGFRQCCVH